MKFRIPLTGNILSPLSLKIPNDFLNIVEIYCEMMPCALPEKWGWWEPLKNEFDRHNLTILVPASGVCETVYWQRKKRPKTEGSFSVRWCSKSPKVYDTHSNVNITYELDQIDQNAFVEFLKKTSIFMEADFSFLDCLSDSYRNFSIESGSAPYGERFMVTTHLLRHWLPDIFWGTIFGPAYVSLFGKDRLLTTPAYHVEELGPEMVYIQLTSDVRDVLENAEMVKAKRELIKSHIGKNAFFTSGHGYDRLQKGPVGDKFMVPTFKLN
jgi:hypothetical protein